ncbi:hypothetical protein J6TS1_09610 [Siminovitchia terrae]|uniref:Uncharacterized protein n=1 Tax=Siminovitchia terrae TaxID=1914933 RepID=A0ABQ4KSU5_SIMTE|nr:hypothetical protein [Siminovitchia terrae]GIN95091.1 hypothetical protein J6TS1_09610 [Siminovitchia terrae]
MVAYVPISIFPLFMIIFMYFGLLSEPLFLTLNGFAVEPHWEPK